MKTSRHYFFKTITVLAISSLAATLQNCATTTWSMPTAERLVELGIVEPDADLKSLNRGRATAIMDCRDCHRQYWPQEFAPKRWPRLTHNMGRLASMRKEQIDDLRFYMIEASKTVEAETAAQPSKPDRRE